MGSLGGQVGDGDAEPKRYPKHLRPSVSTSPLVAHPEASRGAIVNEAVFPSVRDGARRARRPATVCTFGQDGRF